MTGLRLEPLMLRGGMADRNLIEKSKKEAAARRPYEITWHARSSPAFIFSVHKPTAPARHRQFTKYAFLETQRRAQVYAETLSSNINQYATSGRQPRRQGRLSFLSFDGIVDEFVNVSLPQSAEFSAPNSVPQFGDFCSAPLQ